MTNIEMRVVTHQEIEQEDKPKKYMVRLKGETHDGKATLTLTSEHPNDVRETYPLEYNVTMKLEKEQTTLDSQTP